MWADYIKVSIPFGLIKLWVNWSLRIDLIILAWFWTNQVVGWYGAAHAIILGIIVISSSVNAALYPRLSRQFTEDPRLMASIYEFAIKYLLVIALPIAGGISLVAGKTVELLYGAQYAPTALALAIIIWILPLVSISEFFRYVLLVTNREKVAVQTLLFAALLHVVLNLWLVPTYGFLAAAVVSVASELVLILLYIHHLKREFKSINFGNVVLKPLAATLILIGVVTILSPNGLILQVGLGALAYFFAIWVLGVVNLDDFRQLLFSLLSYKQPLPELTMTETSKSNPLVSIFIPAYNAGQFLTQAIESVLSQTYSNYELIIIDDCSTDNTADILKQYQSHSSVRIYHNPVNTGMAPNWNIGLSKCRGELVAKLDADDFYEPDYLETMVEFFRNNETVGLLFSGLNLIYPDDRREPEMRFLRSWVRDRASFLPRLLQSCIIRSPTVCVRRACYERLGGFVEQMRLHADWEMWVRIAANYPVGYVARRLANYRTSYGQNTTAQSITNGWSMQDLRHWLDLLENDQLPYRLAEDEEFNFRWGIYNLEMHFAAISAYNRQNKLQQVYTAFAEESLPYRPSALTIEEMRWAYTNFHQGIHAFRENNPKEAWHYFLQAIKPSRSLQSWPKLILIFKITKRLAGGLSYHLFVKYCPGL